MATGTVVPVGWWCMPVAIAVCRRSGAWQVLMGGAAVNAAAPGRW